MAHTFDFQNNQTLLRSQHNLNNVLNNSLSISSETGAPSPHSPYYDHDSLIKHFKQHIDEFKILSLNCQSLNAKVDQLQVLINELSQHDIYIDAICLQETWFKETEIPPSIQIPNYQTINQPKHCSEHGGLLIYIRDTYEYEQLTTNNKSDHWESQFIKIQLQSESLTLGNIYRPPHKRIAHLGNFITSFNATLHECSKAKNVVKTGDFNINLLNINSANSTHTQEFLTNIITNGFLPNITLPTRISETTASLIDNCLCKLHCKKTSSGVLIHKISDHQPHFVTLSLKSKRHFTHKTIQIRKINDAALTAIGENVNLITENLNLSENACPNDNYALFSSILHSSIDEHLPISTVKFNRHKHKGSPWITSGIIKSIKERDKLYSKLKRTVHVTEREVLKLTLQLYNRVLQKTIRKAKYTYYHSHFEVLKNNMKKTWHLINKIIHKKGNSKTYPDNFSVNGEILSEPTEIATAFNSYFTNIGEELASKIIHTGPDSHKDFLTEEINSSFEFQPVNENEIARIVEKIKGTSSCGYDQLPSKLLKLLIPHLKKPLSLIINQSLQTGVFPDALKIAKVIPIHKKDDNTNISNYRPISLLPAISKVFERVIHKQLQQYFNENNLFYHSQYGFRPKHSTELAALHLIDKLTLDMDANEVPINIYLDLSKAFDTINHEILLDKLQHYGVNGKPHELLKNYLTNRKQYVHLKDTDSSQKVISTGVPQGSILGPLLFIIYINDLHKACTNFTPIIYADDTTLYSKLSSFKGNISTEINKELQRVNNWLKINKLSLNVSKTKFMIFHKPQKKITIPTISLNDSILMQCNTFNFLGIQLNQNLTWSDHIKSTSLKISRSIGQLKSLKHFIPTRILLTLYNTTILPHFHYGILAWGSKANLLSKLQKKSVRLITNSRFNAHTEPLLKQHKLLKIEDMYKLQQLNFFFKLKHQTLPQYFTSFSTTMNTEIHQHNTRRRSIFQARVNHEFAKTSLRNSLITLINKTPAIITDKIHTHSFHGFSTYAKNHYLSTYTTACQRHNCYSCTNNQS